MRNTNNLEYVLSSDINIKHDSKTDSFVTVDQAMTIYPLKYCS